jgi:3-isopropylmalate dehydrogenase
MILSVSMMLKYSLCLPEIAKAIDVAVENALEGGVRTKDIGGKASTTEMSDAIIAELTTILKKA